MKKQTTAETIAEQARDYYHDTICSAITAEDIEQADAYTNEHLSLTVEVMDALGVFHVSNRMLVAIAQAMRWTLDDVEAQAIEEAHDRAAAALVDAYAEAIADRWTQDHQPRDLFSEQAEYEQRAAELAAVEAAASEALESEGNPEDAVNLIAYTAFADIHDGATPDTYDDNDMEQLERLMGYASEIVRRNGPAHGIQWAPYQRCELEAFLGEPDDYDVDAIEAEATTFTADGARVWAAFGEDLAAIAERHELYQYSAV